MNTCHTIANAALSLSKNRRANVLMIHIPVSKLKPTHTLHEDSHTAVAESTDNEAVTSWSVSNAHHSVSHGTHRDGADRTVAIPDDTERTFITCIWKYAHMGKNITHPEVQECMLAFRASKNMPPVPTASLCYDDEGSEIDLETKRHLHRSLFCMYGDKKTGCVWTVNMAHNPGTSSAKLDIFNVCLDKIVLVANSKIQSMQRWLSAAVDNGSTCRVILYNGHSDRLSDRGMHRPILCSEKFVIFYALWQDPVPDYLRPCAQAPDVLFYGKYKKAALSADAQSRTPVYARFHSTASCSSQGVSADADKDSVNLIQLDDTEGLPVTEHSQKRARTHAPTVVPTPLRKQQANVVPAYSMTDEFMLWNIAKTCADLPPRISSWPSIPVFAPGSDNAIGKERFDSRLEMRWSVFFKSLGVHHIRELATFYMDEHQYTPDFYLLNGGLDNQPMWVEIKPYFPTVEAFHKCRALASRGLDVALMFGDVGLPFAYESGTGTESKEYIAGSARAFVWKRNRLDYERGFGVFTIADGGHVEMKLVSSDITHHAWDHPFIQNAICIANNVVPRSFSMRRSDLL